MAKLLKLRRGTTSQHGSFTGAEGEVTVDTDKETLVVHDGSTAGGHPVAAEDMANVSSANIIGRLANDSITNAKIATNAVNADSIAANSVGQSEIADGAVGSSQLANTAVGQAQIATNGVGEAQIASNAVTTSKIAANAVTASELGSNSVVTSKITDGHVTTDKLANDAVTAAKIVDDAVTSAQLASNSVVASKIASDAVTTAKIADDAVTSAKIQDGEVPAAALASNAVTTAKILNGNVTAAKMADNSVDSQHYVDNSIDSEHLASSIVTTAKLAADCVTNAKLANNSVTADQIPTDTIGESLLKISNGGSNGQVLVKRSGNTGGMTWETVSADGGNAATLDGLDSSQFLRSDTSDQMTNGTLRITSGKLGVGNIDPGSSFGNRSAAIALGDNDTGVAQNGDGQLELWANNQEVVNISSTDVSIIKTLKYNNGFGSESVCYGCRVWVSFNGQSEGIYGDGNVSSVGDEGNAEYKVNFSNSMPNTNFATGGSVVGAASGGYNATPCGWGGQNTGWVKLNVQHMGDQRSEVPRVNIMCFA